MPLYSQAPDTAPKNRKIMDFTKEDKKEVMDAIHRLRLTLYIEGEIDEKEDGCTRLIRAKLLDFAAKVEAMERDAKFLFKYYDV